jgi:hypothetical protein
VASPHSRRNSEETREHEDREHRCNYDGCAHDSRTDDKRLAHHLAFLAVTRRTALRPRAPEALGVPRWTVPFARLPERFGQEIVIAPIHDSAALRAVASCTYPPRYIAVRLSNVVGGVQGGWAAACLRLHAACNDRLAATRKLLAVTSGAWCGETESTADRVGRTAWVLCHLFALIRGRTTAAAGKCWLATRWRARRTRSGAVAVVGVILVVSAFVVVRAVRIRGR